ncbi:MAG: isochorismatase family cysteine hydrolase [Pyrinomonadaceae bacterium]
MLVAVDMQLGFLNESSGHILPTVTDLIDDMRNIGVETICTLFRNPPDSPYERLMNWTRVRNSPETDLHPTLAAMRAITIEKGCYTAITPEFNDLAELKNWRNLIICGVSTESCVLKTAVDAFEQDYRPIVIADACASDLGDEMHRMGLAIIEVLIGKDQVMTSKEFFAAL